MNDKRRSKIREAIGLIDRAEQTVHKARDEAVALIAKAERIVDRARDDEQDAFDNLPESIQDSERGEKISRAAEALDNAVDGLSDVKTSLQEAVE